MSVVYSLAVSRNAPIQERFGWVPPSARQAGDLRSPPACVASVAVEDAAVIYELADGGGVPAAIHDGELGLRQSVNGIKPFLISEIGGFADDVRQVVGNEYRRVAEARVRRVGRQADDSVVRDAAAAGHVQRPHPSRLI